MHESRHILTLSVLNQRTPSIKVKLETTVKLQLELVASKAGTGQGPGLGFGLKVGVAYLQGSLGLYRDNEN